MATKRCACLIAVSMLFAGLTNAHAHVHYCFDGQEPPAAVHLADGLDHHHDVPAVQDHEVDGAAADNAGGHDDLDVDLPNQALAKSVKHDLPALAPLLRWAAPVAAACTYTTAQHAAAPPRPQAFYARPEVRGPPR